VEVAKEEPPKGEPAPSAPTQAAEPVTTAKAPASSVPPPPPSPDPSHEPAAGEFSVQVFAFSDDKGANSLVNKLKKAGFPAYTEPVNTSRGTLWRVRVGPYPSRESASAAREKLKGEGYNGIVAAAK
jgi:DedD protein